MTMRPVCGLGPRLGLALALAATPAAAQHGIWLPVRCDLKPNHYLVNAGLLYLKSAAEGRFQEQIQKDLKDANRNLLQAVTANGQDQNPAAWYYLGRYYGMVKDAAGADSAFRRAEQLKPACKDDIAFWRRDLWVPLYNGAVAAYNAAQSDSAIHLLQQANAIYAGEPTGFKLLGALFYNANEADSAARYFRLAIAASSDPKYATDKKEALFNVAASYYRAQRWPEAEAAYKDYLAVVPNDAQALAGLAAVYTSLAKTPFFRDGLFNLANTYLALHDSAKMLPVAQRLYAIDPMNRSTLRLLAQGFQFQKKPDSTLHYLMVADTALPIEVTVGSFLPGDQNATLSGLFTNYRSLPDSATLVSRCRAPGPATTVAARCGYQKLAADAAAKLTTAPLKVTFEFLNAKGEVVVAQSVDVPAIEPGGNHPFQLKANGAKIEAWRYKQS